MAWSPAGITEPEFGHELVDMLADCPSRSTQQTIIEVLRYIHTPEVANALLRIVNSGARSLKLYDEMWIRGLALETAACMANLANLCDPMQVSEMFDHFLEEQALQHQDDRDSIFNHVRAENIFSAIGKLDPCRFVPIMIRVLRHTNYRNEGGSYAYNLSRIVDRTVYQCGKEISTEDRNLIWWCERDSW
jgi:hypothetical protein